MKANFMPDPSKIEYEGGIDYDKADFSSGRKDGLEVEELSFKDLTREEQLVLRALAARRAT